MVAVRAVDLAQEAEYWNMVVDRAPGANPFARAEALQLLATETDTDVHGLLGEVGEEPAGLFPLFVYRRGPLAATFSPPPYAWSCYLGPSTVHLEPLSRRTADRRIQGFLESCLDWIDSTVSPVYSQYVAAEFEDVRPFIWAGLEVEPSFTYVVDLDGTPEDLLDRFSRDARQNIRSGDDVSCTVEEGDRGAIDAIVEQVAARYEEQGRSFHLSPSFVSRLYDALPAGAIRPYVCRIDGDILGGILTVESDRTIYRWQGGVRPPDAVEVPVNDLLDWHVMRDAQSRGIQRYDLVGAGVQRINRYKAKFDPILEPYYTVTDGSFGVDKLVAGYRTVGSMDTNS